MNVIGAIASVRIDEGDLFFASMAAMLTATVALLGMFGFIYNEQRDTRAKIDKEKDRVNAKFSELEATLKEMDTRKRNFPKQPADDSFSA